MIPCPSLSPSRSVDGYVTTCALSGNKLAFFFCFKTTPDYFECIPLGTKRIWFSLHCRWVFLSTVAEETKSSSPYPGDIWGGSLLAAGASVCGFQNKYCLHPLPHYCLTGDCFRTHFYYDISAYNGCKTLQYFPFFYFLFFFIAWKEVYKTQVYCIQVSSIQDIRIIS